MSQQNKFDLGISTNKPHLRKKGEEECWARFMESHIKTNDYQCWRIIENGDIPVDLNMKEVDWKPKHYVSLEKNAKARQLIFNGLGREDMDKVIGVPTTKGIWKALKEIHEGSKELQESRKFALQEEYHKFSMEETEIISEYYSRFTRLITKLSTSGVEVEETSKSMMLIDWLNFKFLLIKG